MSRETYVDGIEWRQQIACGLPTLLDTMEDVAPNLDLDDLFFPVNFQDVLLESPTSMFKRHKSTFRAISGIAEIFDTMSFMDVTVDAQFTGFETAPIDKVSSDGVLAESVLWEHPGRRFERPQGPEKRLSPPIRVLARKVLDERLSDGGYKVCPLSSEAIINQPIHDFLFPRMYTSPRSRSD